MDPLIKMMTDPNQKPPPLPPPLTSSGTYSPQAQKELLPQTPSLLISSTHGGGIMSTPTSKKSLGLLAEVAITRLIEEQKNEAAMTSKTKVKTSLLA